MNIYPKKHNFVREREKENGQWAVYYTSPKNFIKNFLIFWLNFFGDFGTHPGPMRRNPVKKKHIGSVVSEIIRYTQTDTDPVTLL